MTVYLDKARIFSLQETLGNCFMKIDDQELRREINRQSRLLEELGKLEEGTLLELI
jgi:hypothetical protein